MTLHRITAAFAALMLAIAGVGCAAPPRTTQFVLSAAPSNAATSTAATTAKSALLVMPTAATRFYDTPAIAYSRSPGTRAYYQQNSWTESPRERFGTLLAERLDRSGAFRSVASALDGVHGQLVLRTQLEEIYHDASTTPGSARISLLAVLSAPGTRQLIAQRRFEAVAPTATEDATGAVAAFGVATARLLDEVVAWAAASAERVDAGG
jgi:cholesterol transport system auxiliary component